MTTTPLTRDFTVATFVVCAGQVLFLRHRRLRMWLPPGGHIDANELPDAAAVREVREETGIHVALWGEHGPQGKDPSAPRPLVRPAGIQLETIGPHHEHIDLIYYAYPIDNAGKSLSNAPPTPWECDEHDGAGWYAESEWDALGVHDEVQEWGQRALAALAHLSITKGYATP